MTAGTKFKSGRRKAIIREVVANGYRYSLLKANGEPSNPVYFIGQIDPAKVIK